MADGKKIKRKIGIAPFEYKKHKGEAPVIFKEKGDAALLGATALKAT